MNYIKVITLIVMTASIFNCSEYPKDTEILQINEKEIAASAPDANAGIIIGPAAANTQTIITLKPIDSSLSKGQIHWFVNGSEIVNASGYRFVPEDYKKGNVIQAAILYKGKEYRSNEITLVNSPPVVRRASLVPELPKVSSTLTVDIESTDPDNDTVTYTYKWTLNGTYAGEDNFLNSDLKRDDVVTVEVAPYDGEEYGRTIVLKSRVYNSFPVVSESVPTFDGKVYTYQIAATDQDNDSLVYSLEEGPQGMSIDRSTGIVTWTPGPDVKGTYEAKVVVSDNHGGTILVPFTTTIGFETVQSQKAQ